MRDPSQIDITIRGQAVLTLAHIDRFVSEIPEDRVPPSILNRLIAGEELDPAELYSTLDRDGWSAAGDSVQAQRALEAILAELRTAFPEDITRPG